MDGAPWPGLSYICKEKVAEGAEQLMCSLSVFQGIMCLSHVDPLTVWLEKHVQHCENCHIGWNGPELPTSRVEKKII